jgi:hypothetical protein
MKKSFFRICSVLLLVSMMLPFAISCAQNELTENGETEKSSQTLAQTEAKETEKATKPVEENNTDDDYDEENIEIDLDPFGDRVPYVAENIPLARRVASEGMVLLKNKGAALPITPKDNVLIEGEGVGNIYGGGTGSGSMNVETVDFLDGMKHKQRENKLTLNKEITSLYNDNAEYKPTYIELMKAAKVSNKAVFTVCRVSGEGSDRSASSGDYYLSEEEIKMLDDLADNLYTTTASIPAEAQK